MNVRLWTGATGLVHGNRRVLETLAATNSPEESQQELPTIPLIWLTQNPESINGLPRGSRWVFWPNLEQTPRSSIVNQNFPGLEIQPERSLQLQLQSRIE